jgi:hypothetical protein
MQQKFLAINDQPPGVLAGSVAVYRLSINAASYPESRVPFQNHNPMVFLLSNVTTKYHTPSKDQASPKGTCYLRILSFVSLI